MSSGNDVHNIVVSKNNHEAFIVITGVLGVIWTVLVITIRVYLRLRLNGPFGLDDAAALFGTIVGICQTSVTLYAVHNGIGKRSNELSPDQIETGLKSIYAASILYICAICASKCSMSLLIARLTRTKLHLVASQILSGVTVVWGIAAVFIAAFQCSLPQPWNISDHDQCGGFFAHWAAIESLSIFIEVLISCCSVLLVWGLFMSFKMKATVVGAFSLQLLIICPATFRLIFLRDLAHRTSDPTFDLTNPTITTQVVMHFSLIAATFPCMRKFLQAFDLNMGATTKLDTEYGTNVTGSGSYHLKSVERPTEVRSKPVRPPAQFRPELGNGSVLGNGTVTTVMAGSRTGHGGRETDGIGRDTGRERGYGEESRSIESDGSDQAIIRKTQQWDVRYETRE